MSELWAAVWQGGIIFIALSILFAGSYFLIYWWSWARTPHWFEAFRDRFKLRYLAENRFWPWIHQDSQYWVVRLRFDRGPVVVEGEPPACRYWSINYYPAQEHSFSINISNVRLDDEGTYRVTLGQDVEDSEEEQSIRVEKDLKRGIVELRITLPDIDQPIVLPSVYQNDVPLVQGGEV
jgi:hypothetical protein